MTRVISLSFDRKRMAIARTIRLAYAAVKSTSEAKGLAREIGIIWPRQTIELQRGRSGVLTLRPSMRQPKRKDLADLSRTIRSLRSRLEQIADKDSTVEVHPVEFVHTLMKMTSRPDGRVPADVLANYGLSLIAAEPCVRRCRLCTHVFVAEYTRGNRGYYCTPECKKARAKRDRK